MLNEYEYFWSAVIDEEINVHTSDYDISYRNVHLSFSHALDGGCSGFHPLHHIRNGS